MEYATEEPCEMINLEISFSKYSPKAQQNLRFVEDIDKYNTTRPQGLVTQTL